MRNHQVFIKIFVKLCFSLQILINLSNAADNVPASFLSEPEITKNDLQKMIDDLKALAKKYESLPESDIIPPSIYKKGDKSIGVRFLKSKLKNDNFLSCEMNDTFDDALEEAIKKFQSRYSLNPDGVVGPKTLCALNLSNKQKIKIIERSINSLKQIELKDTQIIVSVPLFKLDVFFNAKKIMSQKVIVGMSSRKTPFIKNNLTHVIFYPHWSVPASIFERDKKRHIVENPGYIEKHNFTVFDENGDEIDPHDIDWKTISKNYYPYSIRQAPGPHNALGIIKFHLDNNLSIYMHGAAESQQKLFNKCHRALSSGCIRVEDPKSIAKLLLNKDDKFIENNLKEIKTKYYELNKKIPVILSDICVFIENDEVFFGDLSLIPSI